MPAKEAFLGEHSAIVSYTLGCEPQLALSSGAKVPIRRGEPQPQPMVQPPQHNAGHRTRPHQVNIIGEA